MQAREYIRQSACCVDQKSQTSATMVYKLRTLSLEVWSWLVGKESLKKLKILRLLTNLSQMLLCMLQLHPCHQSSVAKEKVDCTSMGPSAMGIANSGSLVSAPSSKKCWKICSPQNNQLSCRTAKSSVHGGDRRWKCNCMKKHKSTNLPKK